jgi:hypothetical protein
MESPHVLRRKAADARRHADLLGDEQARADLLALAESLEREAAALEARSTIPRSKN